MNAVVQTGSGVLVPHSLNEAMQLAAHMSRAKLVPAALQSSPGDCLLVIEQAARWGMSPFAVAQEVSVIHGRLMYSGKIVAAAIHAAPGVLVGRLHYEYSGEGDGRTITVSGKLRGESEPRSINVCIRDAKTDNHHWRKQPDQQLAYFGARVWARRYVPEVMLGVYAPEEFPLTDNGQVIEGRVEPATDIIDRGQPKEVAKAIGDDLPDELTGRNEDKLSARVRGCVLALEVAESLARVEKLRPHVRNLLNEINTSGREDATSLCKQIEEAEQAAIARLWPTSDYSDALEDLPAP